MPRVSICIPAYNPEYFEISLRSALAQTIQDVELIVSDDCPTDAIKTIVDRYQGLVRYSRNPAPGVMRNIARLIDLAQGEYIKFVFDDDILNPFCTQFLVEAMEATRNKNTVLAFSPRYTINAAGQFTGLINPFNIQDRTRVIEGADFIRVTAIKHHNLIGEFSSVLFRRKDCFDDEGKLRIFDVDGMVLPDLATWLDLAQRGNIVAHPHPLSYFRQHDAATSNPARSPDFIHCVLYYEKVLNTARERGYLGESDLPQSYSNLAKVYRYWAPTFPQLNEAIERFEANAAGLASR